jgi:hypothetical protein
MLSSMRWRAATVGLVCIFAVSGAGCGSSGPGTTTSRRGSATLGPLKTCLRSKGYTVAPESVADVRTAPRRFKFTAVWNLLNSSRVALALTFSSDPAGAEQAAVWTRHEDAKIGRGVVIAPVVRIGRIDVLWTASPGGGDVKDVYGCVRRHT